MELHLINNIIDTNKLVSKKKKKKKPHINKEKQSL